MDPLATALSGVRAAELRLAVSAHNVANLSTPSFRPLRATQLSQPGGGSAVYVDREPRAREVDLTREILEQTRAGFQLQASLRVYAAASEARGYLIDLVA